MLFNYKNTGKGIEFIRFNGEFISMTGLILITGFLFSGVTVGLFPVMNMDTENLYFLVEQIMGRHLPIYTVWTVVMIFILSFVFGMK